MSLKKINESVKGEIVESAQVEVHEGRRCLFVKFQSGKALEFVVAGEHLNYEVSTLLPKKEPDQTA